MPLAALIFDVDGTMAETEELHREAFNASFAAAGLPWHWDQEVYAGLLETTGGKERIRHYIAASGTRPLDKEAIARLHADKTARYEVLVASASMTLRPGVARLLDEAQAAGLRLAIATTTSPANVTALLAATLGPGGLSRFAVISAGDSVPAKKPAPDIYSITLEQLRLPPECCVAFEDTPNGLQAARGAAIPTIVTTSAYGGTTGFDGAFAVVDHLGEPDLPCRMLRGPTLADPAITVALLRAWLG